MTYLAALHPGRATTARRAREACLADSTRRAPRGRHDDATAEQAVGAPRGRCMHEGLEEVERRVGAVGHVVAASGGRGH